MAATPRTILVPLDAPARTQTYQLAPGIAQYVESVSVVIDNSAGADTTPSLTITDPPNSVIGVVPQRSVIPGGDTGRALWALRLADDGGGGGGSFTPTQEFLADVAGPFGTLVNPGATALAPWTHLGGASLLDTTTPTVPTYLAAGFYIFDCNFNVVPSGAVTAGKQMSANLTFNDFVIPIGVQQTFVYIVLGVGQNAASMSITREGFAGVGFQFQYVNGDVTAGHTANFQLTATVTKIS